jgi:hypothetical protein
VQGSEASAEAVFTGGSFDGQALEIGLVNEGGQWKLNHIVGFGALDKPKLVEAIAREFESQGGVSQRISACIEKGVEESSQAKIEELLFSGSTQPIEELAKGCSS